VNKKAVIEWQYLPPVQYFSKWVLYDTIILENQENYRKGSYRNRTYIAGANGPLRLSIPLRKGKNQQRSIRDVEIAYDQPWPQQHWGSIQSAYGSAPFFPFYADELAPLFQERPARLIEWNHQFLTILLELLGLSAELPTTRAWARRVPPDTDDLRDIVHPGKHPSVSDPHFIPKPYMQVFAEKHGFLPNLSILDLLFCAGPESYSILEASIPNRTG